MKIYSSELRTQMCGCGASRIVRSPLRIILVIGSACTLFLQLSLYEVHHHRTIIVVIIVLFPVPTSLILMKQYLHIIFYYSLLLASSRHCNSSSSNLNNLTVRIRHINSAKPNTHSNSVPSYVQTTVRNFFNLSTPPSHSSFLFLSFTFFICFFFLFDLIQLS